MHPTVHLAWKITHSNKTGSQFRLKGTAWLWKVFPYILSQLLVSTCGCYLTVKGLIPSSQGCLIRLRKRHFCSQLSQLQLLSLFPQLLWLHQWVCTEPMTVSQSLLALAPSHIHFDNLHLASLVCRNKLVASKDLSHGPIIALAELISDWACFPSLTEEETNSKQPHSLSQVTRLQKIQPPVSPFLFPLN